VLTYIWQAHHAHWSL